MTGAVTPIEVTSADESNKQASYLSAFGSAVAVGEGAAVRGTGIALIVAVGAPVGALVGAGVRAGVAVGALVAASAGTFPAAPVGGGGAHATRDRATTRPATMS
jgi:hypothetical protein